MADEIRIKTRITVEIVFKQVNDDLHLESTATFNKQQQNGYKIATIEFVEDLDQEGETQNDSEVLQIIAGVVPKLRNIVSLKLAHCNLTSFPKSLCVLPLKYLDLRYNLLKAVPVCLSIGLPDLEELDLSHNQIRCFETEPKCIRKLIVLNIEDNMLVNIPQWVLRVKCTKLQKLCYNENDLTSLKKARFATTIQYKLSSLYLRNCCLMDDDFKILKTIRTLKVLDIGNTGNKNCNGFSKLELLFEDPHFANYIESFCVSNVSLSYMPENVVNLKYLKHLNISNNNLSWLPECIVGLRFLQHLNFSVNKIISLPRDFNKLENLEELVGPFNSLAHVPDIDIPRLRCVDLYNNEISAFDLNLENLQMADFERNFIDTTRLSANYTQSLNAFRSKHKHESRLFNEKEDFVYGSPSDRWSLSSSETSDMDNDGDNEVIMSNCNADQCEDDDEEQWDVVVDDTFANITLSDSEWTGQPYVNKIKNVETTEYCVDYLYEDAD